MCVEQEQEQEQQQPQGKMLRWPEERSPDQSFLSAVYQRWTYSYMNRVLKIGSSQQEKKGSYLTSGDLYCVPPSSQSRHLSSLFYQYYKEEEEKQQQRKDSSSPRTNRVLLRTIFRVAAPHFVPAGVHQFLTVLAQVAIPLLVRGLLSLVQDNPRQSLFVEGIPYVLGIFGCSLVNAIANHRHRHLATQAGVVVRASIVSVVYQHALFYNKSTAPQQQQMTSGQVTNLVAVDTQKLYEVFMEGHLIWSCPLSMTIVGSILLLLQGVTSLVGMLVLLFFVPVVKRIANHMGKIRHDRVSVSDQRVEVVNSMMAGIKVTKLNNYEVKYQEKVSALRHQELRLLRRELFVWAMTLVVTVISPVIASAATFMTYALVNESNVLTPARTFTVLLLFASLRFPINYVGRLIGKLGQALEAARRIDGFLRSGDGMGQPCDEKNDSDNDEHKQALGDGETPNLVLEARDAAFGVGSLISPSKSHSDHENVTLSYAFRLSGVNCTLKAGEIMAVVGTVGSGKSTLINGLIDEVKLDHGSLDISTKKISYASQIPFVLNATLRDNILFGSEYDIDRYNRVIDACCLLPDLEQLGGDLVEIGERGVTLSGGQKQRVSLARAAYAEPALMVCDDPLSALDAGTGRKIVDRLLTSPESPVATSAIVLVTHAAHFLNRVDKIVVLVKGEQKFVGTWAELAKFTPDDDETFLAVDSIRSSVQEMSDGEEDEDQDHATPTDLIEKKPSGLLEAPLKASNKVDLMTVETREHGLSSLKTWLLWAKYAGGIPFFALQIFLLTIDRLFYVGTEYWLTVWTASIDEPNTFLGREFPPQTDGRSAQAQYVVVYAMILLISSLATFMRSQWAVSGGARCAKNVFGQMLGRVLLAPMSYFETTPMGRIINRFTYDTEIIDMTLTEAMSVLMIATSWFFASVIVMSTIIPYLLLALVPVMVVYVMLMLHYRKSGADLQRIDAVTRSPIQALLAEGLDGSATIKVFGKRHFFLTKFRNATDINSAAVLNFISAQRWLGIRIETLGTLIVLVSTTLVITMNGILQLEAGIVGLLIMWSANFTITLGFLIDHFGDAEAAITSIERVNSMAALPQEAAMETDPSVIALPPQWPDQGALEFENVSIRYRPGLPLALNGLSFRIEPGKLCGVVGRTGAGKSTLTVGLFRLVELEAGRIVIDGIDVSKIGLSDLRSRLAIIPQDPFLFAGTLRECIDPFGQARDDAIVEALQAVRLRGTAGVDPLKILETPVEEGGSNYSVGERQLLCLARALLAKPKVLVMDEATASVDGETDAFIQRMLRTRFKDSTLLTVAHRLNTIMDYDTVLVMDNGRAAEFGPPLELLDNANGIFADLVNSTGEESAAALRAMAASKKVSALND